MFLCGVNRFQADTQAARDKDRKSFVQTKDGTVTVASEAVLRSPLFGKSTIELDKQVKIPTRDIVAYQNSSAYYRRIDNQFAPRIKKGLINMYMTTQHYQEYSAPSMGSNGGSWRTKIRYVYYLQKGDSASSVRFRPRAVKEYVQDYEPAMEYMNVYAATERKVKIWALINTGAVIGGALLLMSQGIKNEKVTTAGYASSGMVVGGFVNGFVNRIRRAKNAKNLELAIDEYNFQATRKKRR
jgi:hypothetical protein